MNRYICYCTEEQTKKAIELGAPIDFFEENEENNEHAIHVGQGLYAIIPTAEQMINWLEEYSIAIDLHTYFKVNNSRINHYEYTVTDSTRVFNGSKITRKEATLAAINAALNYLTEKKGE